MARLETWILRRSTRWLSSWCLYRCSCSSSFIVTLFWPKLLNMLYKQSWLDLNLSVTKLSRRIRDDPKLIQQFLTLTFMPVMMMMPPTTPVNIHLSVILMPWSCLRFPKSFSSGSASSSCSTSSGVSKYLLQRLTGSSVCSSSSCCFSCCSCFL